MVWLKRDLRLAGHQALSVAAGGGVRVLVCVVEPMLLSDPHYSERRWRFYLAIFARYMNHQLASVNSQVLIFQCC